MNIRESLLSQETLAGGAFLLMTCSSLTRYKQMSKQLAKSSGLSKLIASGEVSINDVIGRARQLWQDVQRSTGRGLEELELAIITGAISTIASDEVNELLIDLSLADMPSCLWISALARGIYSDRPANNEDSIPENYLATYRFILWDESDRMTRRLSPHHEWTYLRNNYSQNHPTQKIGQGLNARVLPNSSSRQIFPR